MALKILLIPRDAANRRDTGGEHHPDGGVLGEAGARYKGGEGRDVGDFRERLRVSHEDLESAWRRIRKPGLLPGGPNESVMLAGIGCLIVDEVGFDSVEVGRLGIRVIDNTKVSVPPGEDSRLRLESKGWHLDNINASGYHRVGRRGAGVWIGVLDSGVDPNASDFQGRSAATDPRLVYKRFPADGTDDPSRLPWASHVHGTRVAALAAGATHGVAPLANLAIGHVFTGVENDLPSGSFAQLAAGLNWLITTDFRAGGACGVDVISVSGGEQGFHDDLYEIIARAREDFGIQVVASVGNELVNAKNGHWSPGNYDNVIGVGAVNELGCTIATSAFGTVTRGAKIYDKPDLSAPGYNLDDPTDPTSPRKLAGTSYATPLVAGACALLIEADLRRDAGNRPRDLPDRLYQNLRPAPQPGTGICLNSNLPGRGLLCLRLPEVGTPPGAAPNAETGKSVKVEMEERSFEVVLNLDFQPGIERSMEEVSRVYEEMVLRIGEAVVRAGGVVESVTGEMRVRVRLEGGSAESVMKAVTDLRL